MSEHPIGGLDLHVWESPDAPPAYRFLAMFWPYKALPIFFSGGSAAEARAAAEAFRENTIAKHGEVQRIRRETLEKARAARARPENEDPS